MMHSTLSKAAESMQGVLHGADAGFRGVSTDTRSIGPGELFVALQGPNFDGTEFLDAAIAREAAAAVVSKPVDTVLPSIAVDDTRLALGRLAAAWRRQMPATVVGITGSNGKTTLKEMLASCLAQTARTLATHGNLNNDIGLPLMLLRLSEDDRYAVMEMGANHSGEIAYLASLAAPSVVAISNAGPAHLEGFGSIDGVASAKGEILQVEPRPQSAILNADDAYYEYWKAMAEDLELFSFGFSRDATVSAHDIEATASGSRFMLHLPQCELPLDLPLPGIHNVRNACAAAAIALALKLPPEKIKSGLESVAPVAARLRPLNGVNGARVFDDSYNANPASVIAAAEFLAAQHGESILVLGDMGELGPDSTELHRSVGAAAKSAGVGRLLATGALSQYAVEAFGEGASWYAGVQDIIDTLSRQLRADHNVLVKGSRSMHMGRVVRAIALRPPCDKAKGN